MAHVAKHLWKECTGHDYLWNPNNSDELNEALRRMADMPSLDKIKETGIDDPKKLVAVAEQFSRDFAVLDKAHNRYLKKGKWLLISILIFAVISIGLKLIKYLS